MAAVKADWADGDTFTSTAANDVATALNLLDGSTSTGRGVLTAASQSAARTAISAQATDADLDAIAALSPTNDDIIQRKSGAWTNRTIAQLKSDLALNNVTNNAQYYSGGTDVAVTDGGTGASDASGARTNLGVAYGTSGTTVCVGNDSRLSDARTPAANTVPCDFFYVAQTGARATGIGDFAVGMRIGRALKVTKVVYQFGTADASGNTSVELRKNGSQVTSSNVTVSAANQADGTGTDSARTATFSSTSFAEGDRLSIHCTAVGTTPGTGLAAWVYGTWD